MSDLWRRASKVGLRDWRARSLGALKVGLRDWRARSLGPLTEGEGESILGASTDGERD